MTAFARAHGVLFACLRLLVVLGAFGLSGLAPAVAELMAGGQVHDAAGCSDCPLEQDGTECPPGCPSCHCVHAGISLPPLQDLRLAILNSDVGPAPLHFETAVPRAPPSSDVYRPPCGLLTLS